MKKILLILLIGLTSLSADFLGNKTFTCFVTLKDNSVTKHFQSGSYKNSAETQLRDMYKKKGYKIKRVTCIDPDNPSSTRI